MNIKSLIGDFARRRGYAIVPLWRLENMSLSQALRGIFDARQIECVIDVGANRGQYHDFLRAEVGYRGRIVSYEPHPQCYEQCMQKATQDPLWEIRNLGLGFEAGELTLNVMRSLEFNSFLQPSDSGGKLFDRNCVADSVRVPVSTLNLEMASAVPEKQSGAIYLKLDTQGFDLNILKGAGDLLPRVAALQTELSLKPIYEHMPDYREVIDFLNSQGFELNNTFSVSHAPDGAAIELDGVFVNTRTRLF